MKAKSRLRPKPEILPVASEPSRAAEIKNTPVTFSHKPRSHEPSLSHRYLSHLLTLLLAVPFYGIVFFVYQTVLPTQIKNLGVDNLYLGFQLPLFLGNFFLLSFLTLNSRRGLFWALGLQLVVFSRLQALSWSPIQLLVILLGFVIIEASFVLYHRKHHG